jgi:hypothetical protein
VWGESGVAERVQPEDRVHGPTIGGGEDEAADDISRNNEAANEGHGAER